jgi:hypothetical protein
VYPCRFGQRQDLIDVDPQPANGDEGQLLQSGPVRLDQDEQTTDLGDRLGPSGPVRRLKQVDGLGREDWGERYDRGEPEQGLGESDVGGRLRGSITAVSTARRRAGSSMSRRPRRILLTAS